MPKTLLLHGGQGGAFLLLFIPTKLMLGQTTPESYQLDSRTSPEQLS